MATTPLIQPDAGTTLLSQWRLGTSERQWASVDAIASTWESKPWPDADLLSYNTFIGSDGTTLLHSSHWTSGAAYDRFLHTQRQVRVDEIDAAVPGIERLGINRFQRYRSTPRDLSAPPTGAVVAVTVEFEGPDAERLRGWVDATPALDESTQQPLPGLIQSHFHLSDDGTRVLNFTEWTSEQAHIDAFGEQGGAGVGGNPEGDRLMNHPGVKQVTFERYLPAWGAESPARV